MTYTITRADAAADTEALQNALNMLKGSIFWDSPAAKCLLDLRRTIEQQAKTTIEEPEAFGSVVRAGTGGPDLMLWQLSPMHGKHYWESETGAVEVWSELTDVEVLRVGLGDKCNCPKATPMGYGIELQPDCPQHGADVIRVIKQDAKEAYRKGFEFGMREMSTQTHQRITDLLAEAITSERKNAYEKAIQAVEELAP